MRGSRTGSCRARGRTGRGRCASHVLGKCAGDIEHAEAVAVEKAPHVVVAADLPSILQAMCAGMGPEPLDSLAERKPELRPMATREEARKRGRAHARHLHPRRYPPPLFLRLSARRHVLRCRCRSGIRGLCSPRPGCAYIYRSCPGRIRWGSAAMFRQRLTNSSFLGGGGAEP